MLPGKPWEAATPPPPPPGQLPGGRYLLSPRLGEILGRGPGPSLLRVRTRSKRWGFVAGIRSNSRSASTTAVGSGPLGGGRADGSGRRVDQSRRQSLPPPPTLPPPLRGPRPNEWQNAKIMPGRFSVCFVGNTENLIHSPSLLCAFLLIFAPFALTKKLSWGNPFDFVCRKN